MIVVIAKTSEVVAIAKTVTAVIARTEIVTIAITETIAIGTDAKIGAQDIGTEATAAVHGTHHEIGLEEETLPEKQKTRTIVVADP